MRVCSATSLVLMPRASRACRSFSPRVIDIYFVCSGVPAAVCCFTKDFKTISELKYIFYKPVMSIVSVRFIKAAALDYWRWRVIRYGFIQIETLNQINCKSEEQIRCLLKHSE